MSVLPVTDALQRLQEAGLIETRARARDPRAFPARPTCASVCELREAPRKPVGAAVRRARHRRERLEIRRLAAQVDVLFNRLTASGDDPELASSSTAITCSCMRIAEHARSQLLQRRSIADPVLIPSTGCST